MYYYECVSQTDSLLICVALGKYVKMYLSVICLFYVCRERIRFQRRAKLKFGTKLGMNSPF